MATDAPTAAPIPGESAAFPAPASPAPSLVEDAELTGAEVTVIGRSAAPVARLGELDAGPVLVGAASAARDDESRSSTTSDPAPAAPWSRWGSGATTAEDAPRWSFARAETAAVATPAAVDRNQVELLFTSAAQPGAPPPRPQPTFGPVGLRRSVPLLSLLAAVTLGVYALVWYHRINRELEDFDPQLHARPARSTVAVALPWLLGLLITVAGAVLVVTARLAVHLPFDAHLTVTQAFYLLAGLAAVPYLSLLIPFSLVAVVMTLERLRSVEEHVGTTSDRQVRPVGTSLFLAVPIIGGLVLLCVAQSRINVIWDAMAPTRRSPS